MKKNLLFLLGILVIYTANAQDTIVLRNNSIIKCKVMEIGTSEIRYKKIENLDGPVYSVNKAEVQMIKYENGVTDTFISDNEKEAEKSKSKKASTRAVKQKDIGTIYVAFSAPMGSFGNSYEGGALPGWGLGLSGFVGDSGMQMSYQLSYSIHPYEFNVYANGTTYTLKGDYNVWHLLAGFGKRGRPSSAMLYMYVMGGLNYNVLNGALEEVGFSDAMNFALSFGVGCIFSGSFNFGLKFMNSKPTFKNKDSGSVKQKISIFQFTGGFQF